MQFKVIIILYLAMLAGLLLPIPANYSVIIKYLLALLVFFNMLSIDFSTISFKQKELLYILICNWGVIPFIAYQIGSFFPLDIQLGWFLLSITPSALASMVMVKMIGGDERLSIIGIIITNILSPFTMAFLLQLYFSNSTISFDYLEIIYNLFYMIGIPFIIILLLRIFKKSIILSINSWYKPSYSIMLWALFILLAVSSVRTFLWSQPLTKVLLLFSSVLILAILNFIVGYCLSHSLTKRKATMITLGQKNTLLTLGIATQFFSSTVTLMVVLYIISHHLVNGFIISSYKTK